MYSLLVQSYLVRNKTNITLQTLNEAIVADLNKLSTQGVQVGDEALYIQKTVAHKPVYYSRCNV